MRYHTGDPQAPCPCFLLHQDRRVQFTSHTLIMCPLPRGLAKVLLTKRVKLLPHFPRSCPVSGALLRSLLALSDVIFPTAHNNPVGRDCHYCTHFADEQTRSPRKLENLLMATYWQGSQAVWPRPWLVSPSLSITKAAQPRTLTLWEPLPKTQGTEFGARRCFPWIQPVVVRPLVSAARRRPNPHLDLVY